MRKFIKYYQDSNPERFNKEFILQKKNDSILDYLIDTCKSLEIIDGIKFIGGELITDECKFDEILHEGKSVKRQNMNIEESRMDLAILKFHIEGIQDKKHMEEEYSIKLFVPKIINDFHYILNGSRYYPIYQIIDIGTYHTKNTLTQKTLLMPIFIQYKEDTLEDINGTTYSNKYFLLNLFKNKVNVFNYYLAKYGYQKTLEFFDLDKIIESSKDELATKKGYTVFKISKNLYIRVKTGKNGLNKNNLVLFTFIQCLSVTASIKYETLNDLNFWKKKLGSVYTKTTDLSAQIEKAERILLSVQRILDEGTKKTLKIDKVHLQDTFTIIRYLITNYNELMHIDNMDLRNKRIRLKEHEIQEFRLAMSEKTYRILNNKEPSFDEKLSIIRSIKPNFLIKACINKNQLLRYFNNVNGIDLIPALKYSFRGPQSLSENNSEVSHTYRGLHESYIGRLDLNTCSNNDPGLTGTLSPFIKVYDNFFSEDTKYYSIDDDKNK